MTAVADSFGEMGSLNADAKGRTRTRTRSFIKGRTVADKLTLRGEFCLGFGDVSEIGSPKKGQTKSTAHLRESRRVCVWPRGP